MTLIPHKFPKFTLKFIFFLSIIYYSQATQKPSGLLNGKKCETDINQCICEGSYISCFNMEKILNLYRKNTKLLASDFTNNYANPADINYTQKPVNSSHDLFIKKANLSYYAFGPLNTKAVLEYLKKSKDKLPELKQNKMLNLCARNMANNLAREKLITHRYIQFFLVFQDFSLYFFSKLIEIFPGFFMVK